MEIIYCNFFLNLTSKVTYLDRQQTNKQTDREIDIDRQTDRQTGFFFTK